MSSQERVFREYLEKTMEIDEHKLKEILGDQRKEYQHFMGIVKEDLQSQIGLIAEQYQDIKDDLSIIKSELR